MPAVPTFKIMVLNDGSTWSPLDGCKIMEVDVDLDEDAIELAISDVIEGNECTKVRLIETLHT